MAVGAAAVDQDERPLGAVKLEVVVSDASRREQWRGVKLGVARADSAEDVTEALAGAFLAALDGWWSDPAFLTAMGRPADPDAALRSRLPAPFSPGGLADTSARKLRNVGLRFRPDDPVELYAQAAARALGGRKIVVAPFQDGRPTAERQLLGRVSGSDRDVTTRDDAARFCTGQLRQLLTNGGVEVVEEGGDLTISATVQRFLVEEQGTSVVSAYDGAVVLEVSVVDAARKPVWRGLALGAASQHGAKYQVENYHEASSDALQRAFRWLFQELGPVTGARTN